MDVTITTSDPEAIDVDEIREGLEVRGYYIASVTVIDRDGVTHKVAGYV